MITIIDYGMGNLGSVKNMLNKVESPCEITNDPEKILKAKKILLPGVGAFDAAIKKITDMGIREVLDHKALKEKVPVLGICLGMQLLTDSSEEGHLPGLGWIPAKTISFKKRINPDFKIPHMGWNIVKINHENSLTKGFNEEVRFYFVHSYFVRVDNERNSAMKTFYGLDFDSAIFCDNIFGAQFHPEKSHRFGMNLLKNFAEM